MVNKMHYKKIVLMVLIVILACVAVSAVQAESNGHTENIRGIDFNIPEGFVESNYSVKDNASEKINATTDIRIYTNNKEIFDIIVIEYGFDINTTLTGDGEKVTIKNINGLLEHDDDDGEYHFKYYKDNHYISICSKDKKLIEEVIK
jgi:hypothetical protein